MPSPHLCYAVLSSFILFHNCLAFSPRQPENLYFPCFSMRRVPCVELVVFVSAVYRASSWLCSCQHSLFCAKREPQVGHVPLPFLATIFHVTHFSAPF
jgi:hypothetical protein